MRRYDHSWDRHSFDRVVSFLGKDPWKIFASWNVQSEESSSENSLLSFVPRFTLRIC